MQGIARGFVWQQASFGRVCVCGSRLRRVSRMLQCHAGDSGWEGVASILGLAMTALCEGTQRSCPLWLCHAAQHKGPVEGV